MIILHIMITIMAVMMISHDSGDDKGKYYNNESVEHDNCDNG